MSREPAYKMKSLGAMLQQSMRLRGDAPAQWLPITGGFEALSYNAMWERVRKFASFLDAHGVQKGDRVVILGENSSEWVLADFACHTLGAIVVPIYPTLPADQAQYIAQDCGAKVALCGSPELAAKLAALDQLAIFHLRGEGSMAEDASIKLLSDDVWQAKIDAVERNELATIIYTSGTTGLPKGAMLPHRCFLHVIEHAEPYLGLVPEDKFFSFLPLSHVFERLVSMVVYGVGASVAFNRSLAAVSSDMNAAQPTVMAVVPRLLESVRERILDGVRKAPPIRQKLFYACLAQNLAKANGKFAPLAPVLDKIVGAKIRERLGGKFRMFVSGGAALAPHVAEFYLGIGLNVLQGYGLTETTGGSCVNHPTRNKYWTVGEPIGVELKIAEDGEILLRGPSVMDGYYNLPEVTAKAIDSDGWFHTGDIGKMVGSQLQITDRKKDILVLGNGKNVAPQPIENKIKESVYIEEAVVLGDGMDHCVALIIPNQELVRKELGLAEAVQLSTSPEVRALMKKEIDVTNKKIAHFEMVKRFAVLDQSFTIDSGELTPSLKVKRKVVREKFADIIATLG